MSALPCLTNNRPGQSLYLLKGSGGGGAVGNFVCSTIIVNNGEIGLGNGEYISTIGNQLFYYNGSVLEPLSALSSISSIEEWSIYPAISTVNYAGENAININALDATSISSLLGTISSLQANTLEASTINTNEFSASNISATSIVVSDLSTLTFTAQSTVHFISTVSSVQQEVQQMTISSFEAEVGSISSLNISSATIENVSFSTLNTSTLVADVISCSRIFVSSINNNEFTTSSVNVNIIGTSSLVANSISSLGAEIRQGLFSTVQFNPTLSNSFDFNFDVGSLATGLTSGLTKIGIGVGAGLAVIGSGIIASAFARSGGTQIVNNTYEQYATPSQLQFSTIGETISSYTRFVSSSSGDGNTVPGVEYFISSIINPGTLCIRSIGDPVNLADPSTYTSSVISFGQWVEVPIEGLVSSFEVLETSSIIGLSSINGFPLQDFFNLSSISSLNEWALYPALSTVQADGQNVSFNNGQLRGTDLPNTISFRNSNDSDFGNALATAYLLQQPSTTTQGVLFYSASTNRINFLNGALGGAVSSLAYVQDLYSISSLTTSSFTVSSINGQPASAYENTSTFDTLFANSEVVSSISCQTILGSAPSVFGLPLPGLEIQAPTVYMSTGQLLVPGLVNTSSVSGFGGNIRNLVVSTITTSSISLAQSGAYGLSSLIGLSTSGTNTGTSSLVTINTDVSLGLNDLYCGQVRIYAGVGATNTTAEIVMTGPDSYLQTIDRSAGDKTFRTRSGGSPAVSTGYFLDTYHNPPLFSTINNQVNLVSFFPSTNASTIGYSTISKMNPVTQYGASTLAGGTVTVVFSPPYANSNEYSVVLTYKDNAGGAPLHANILSVSSFSANGSATNSFFWQTIGVV